MNENEVAVAELLAGAHRQGRGVPWLASFVERTLDGGPVELQVASTVSPGRDGWNVEVSAGGPPLALIDVRLVLTGGPAALDEYLDALTAKATRRWNVLTRGDHSEQVRPWIACFTIGDDEQSGVLARATAELDALVRQRTLDVACVVGVGMRHKGIAHPSPAMSLDAFTAGLIGRKTVWSATVSA